MAMGSRDVYAQTPLVTEQREIRILSLAPGIGDSVLRGELIVESLHYDDLHYTALSYTWSGPVSQCSIIIGGVPLHITANLELALRRIRGPDRPKNIWIDAICINQHDNEEKSVQVLLMGDIYANAARTIVWLGEQSADSDIAMDLIHSLRQRAPYQLDIYSDEESSDEGNSDEEDSDEDSSDEGNSDEKDSDRDERDKDRSETDRKDNGSNKDDRRADDSDIDDSDKNDINEDEGDEDSSDEDDSDRDSSDEDGSDEDKSNEEDTHAENTHEGISDADQLALRAVTNLMQRQWWTRIWVVQEALKSRRVTVVCGAKEVEIAYFAQLVKVKRLRKSFQMV